jgi:hypothetical protein
VIGPRLTLEDLEKLAFTYGGTIERNVSTNRYTLVGALIDGRRVNLGPVTYVRNGDALNAHPLAVIDPEDREQVERLLTLFWDNGTDECNDTKALTAALREFADPTPPKPVVTAEMVVAMRKQIQLDREQSPYWKGEPHEAKLDAAEAWLDSLADWLGVTE